MSIPSDYLQQLQAGLHQVSPALNTTLSQLAQQRLIEHPHGDMPRWQAALSALPDVAAELQADQDVIQLTSQTETDDHAVKDALMGLSPWRKGPFDVFNTYIDCEWRSDWKWQRLAPHIAPLKGRTVLDVGCGSGYHLWRMWASGATQAVGIDPGILFYHQFMVLKRYLPTAPVWLVPARMEELPAKLACFDTVFSMGVLYHRRHPLAHLQELAQTLRKGGELVLETLVIDGDDTRMLMPEGRYAAMRNVWFLPSVALLTRWLRRLGFSKVRCVDVSTTSTDEQRATEWMRFQSLADFLNPADNTLTIEGYPAPKRALVLAEK